MIFGWLKYKRWTHLCPEIQIYKKEIYKICKIHKIYKRYTRNPGIQEREHKNLSRCLTALHSGHMRVV